MLVFLKFFDFSHLCSSRTLSHFFIAHQNLQFLFCSFRSSTAHDFFFFVHVVVCGVLNRQVRDECRGIIDFIVAHRKLNKKWPSDIVQIWFYFFFCLPSSQTHTQKSDDWRLLFCTHREFFLFSLWFILSWRLHLALLRSPPGENSKKERRIIKKFANKAHNVYFSRVVPICLPFQSSISNLILYILVKTRRMKIEIFSRYTVAHFTSLMTLRGLTGILKESPSHSFYGHWVIVEVIC